MFNLAYKDCVVSLRNESAYSFRSVDNSRVYDREYVLSDDGHVSAKHGISCWKADEILGSCILGASGFAEMYSESTVIVKDVLFVAIGNVLCALNLPSLDLQWHKEVDFVACFGVYYLSNEDCLITHGEVDISRISRDGTQVWKKSGKDIFTQEFEIKENHIEAIDFNHEKYRIRIADGQMHLVSE